TFVGRGTGSDRWSGRSSCHHQHFVLILAYFWDGITVTVRPFLPLIYDIFPVVESIRPRHHVSPDFVLRFGIQRQQRELIHVPRSHDFTPHIAFDEGSESDILANGPDRSRQRDRPAGLSIHARDTRGLSEVRRMAPDPCLEPLAE